jgi:hypothetical protein
MHDPFLSCYKLWYGTNRIYYDFVLRATWYPEIFFLKNAKIKSLSMIMNTHQGHMTWYSNSNLSHMLLVWALNFVKLLWPVLRFSSCTHDQDTHTPINKMLTLTLRVTHNMHFSVHQNNTPFTLSWFLSLKSFICQKERYGLC